MLIASSAKTPETASDDPRVGKLLGSQLAPEQPARVSLVGFAVDQGIDRNGGRIGASVGPLAIREQLFKLCPDPAHYEAFVSLLAHTRDLGDLRGSGDLERDQDALGEIVAAQLRAGAFVIVLGGGHETTYGHFLGYVKAGLKVAIQNIDAHADVRALKNGLGHSGSPFRQAIEHPSGTLEHYRVDALQPANVASSHLAYMREHGASFAFRRDFHAELLFTTGAQNVLATFCLDALDQAFAPGVSAPTSSGLSPDEWLEGAYGAGRATNVRSMDCVELCPRLDRDAQTARLAAKSIWEVLRGFAARTLPIGAR
jgi:formiminoglutamase